MATETGSKTEFTEALTEKLIAAGIANMKIAAAGDEGRKEAMTNVAKAFEDPVADYVHSEVIAGSAGVSSADGTVTIARATDPETGAETADLSVAAAIAVEAMEREMADRDILLSIGTISEAEINALE